MYDLRTDVGREKPYGKPSSDDMRDMWRGTDVESAKGRTSTVVNAQRLSKDGATELAQFTPKREKRIRIVTHTGVTGSTALSHNGDDWDKRYQWRGDPDESYTANLAREDTLAKAQLVSRFPKIAAGIDKLRQSLRIRENLRGWIDAQAANLVPKTRLFASLVRLMCLINVMFRVANSRGFIHRLFTARSKRVRTQNPLKRLDLLHEGLLKAFSLQNKRVDSPFA